MVQIKGALPGLSLVPDIACCVSFAGTAAVRRGGETASGVPGMQGARLSTSCLSRRTCSCEPSARGSPCHLRASFILMVSRATSATRPAHRLPHAPPIRVGSRWLCDGADVDNRAMRVREKVALSRDVAAGNARCCHRETGCCGDAEAGNDRWSRPCRNTVQTAGGITVERRYGLGVARSSGVMCPACSLHMHM